MGRGGLAVTSTEKRPTSIIVVTTGFRPEAPACRGKLVVLGLTFYNMRGIAMRSFLKRNERAGGKRSGLATMGWAGLGWAWMSDVGFEW